MVMETPEPPPDAGVTTSSDFTYFVTTRSISWTITALVPSAVDNLKRTESEVVFKGSLPPDFGSLTQVLPLSSESSTKDTASPSTVME